MVRKKIDRIEEIKKKIVKILKKNNVVRAGIFGSYAKGEEKKGSDIDILIEVDNIGLFDLVGIKLDLEDELDKKVDLLTYRSIHPYIKENILASEIRII